MYTALNPYVLPSLLARLLDRFKLGCVQFIRTKLASGLPTARSRFISLPKFLHCSPNSRQPFSAAVTSYNNLLFSFMDTVELSSLRLSYGNLSRRKYLPFLTLDTFQQFKPFTLLPLIVVRLLSRKTYSALQRRSRCLRFPNQGGSLSLRDEHVSDCGDCVRMEPRSNPCILVFFVS